MKKLIREKRIKVGSCNSCPFHIVEYDDFSTGYSTISRCTIGENFKINDNTIDVYNGFKQVKTPDWCPLKKQNILIEFKNK